MNLGNKLSLALTFLATRAYKEKLAFIYLFFLINVLFCLFFFLAALGFLCCVRTFSSCGEQGLLFVAVRGLLVAVASLVAEHWL